MSGGGRKAVAVRIDGSEYKIRSDGADESLVRIAGYVDRAMKRVRERTGTVGSLDVAMLTCLNLAREILALHEKRADPVDDDRLRALIEKVEAALPVDGRAPTERPAEHSNGDVQDGAGQRETSRTLELPPVEDLRDRMVASAASTAPAQDDAALEGRPRARAAGGGRERVA